ncbi:MULTISPECIES: DUF5415 family protein [Enterococcus]|uniref:DUF5415 family protein n=1 Tax=Enterococcus TaxID=1350 RepID=UPI0002A21400|nr:MULTISPECIES: DUF5415 family protein [Enterococcus]OWW63575.1 hypothetical protein F521_06655 [Enterococcus hirae 67-03-C5]OWW65665.1 hypothetical protein C656_09880 [Enterococcus hirae 57-03-H11]EGP5212377.1 hypothetical protein [Enterococcus faecium]ELA51288.1 hypothetical protein OGA_05391 [Enterococcus faecium EnGen0012]ELA83108.1 hypothetical protein OI3_05021 [Enterococcus faecium EnGen0021]
MAKNKTPIEKAASKFLERRGISETQWKKEVLEKAQFDLLRGKDKDLEEYIYQREREKLVFDEIIKH